MQQIDPPTTSAIRRDFVFPLLLWCCWPAGLTINSILAWHLARPEAAMLPGCTADGSGCDTVLHGLYSRVLGQSLTTWAFGYYAVVALALVARRSRPQSTIAAMAPAVVGSLGVATAAWLIGVMRSQLGEYCVWCLALHAANLAFFVIAVVYAQSFLEACQRSSSVASDAGIHVSPPTSRGIGYFAIAAGLALAAAQIVFLFEFRDEPLLTVVPLEGISDPIAALSLATTDGSPVTIKGSASAPRHVVIFSCLTCTHCRKVNQFLNEIVHRHPDRYRIEVRFAPLSKACNPNGEGEGADKPEHRYACELARIAISAATVEAAAFSSLVDWIYTNQHGLTPERAQAEAERRVGATAFQQAYVSPAIEEGLDADVALAGRFNVKVVPRIFLPAGQVEGILTLKNLAELLESNSGFDQRPGEKSDQLP